MSIAKPTFPTPGKAFDQSNESQFRALVDRLVKATVAAVTELQEATVSPDELSVTVVNKTGSSIAAGKIVAISGLDTTTALPKIVLADADVAAHDNLWVTTAAIANDARGVVYRSALSAATLDTSGASAAGDEVYLSTTAGAFTHTAPTAVNARVQPVGMVTVKDASVGQIYWLIGPTRKIGSNELQTGVIPTGEWTEVIAASDFDVTNDNVYHDDPELLYPIVSGGVYAWELFLIYSGSDATVDTRVNFSFPGIIESIRWAYGPRSDTNGTIYLTPASDGTSGSAVVLFGSDIVGGTKASHDISHLRYWGSFIADSSGDVVMQFCNDTVGVGRVSRRKAGSILRYRRLL